jgi:hypothetical protein
MLAQNRYFVVANTIVGTFRSREIDKKLIPLIERLDASTILAADLHAASRKCCNGEIISAHRTPRILLSLLSFWAGFIWLAHRIGLK